MKTDLNRWGYAIDLIDCIHQATGMVIIIIVLLSVV